MDVLERSGVVPYQVMVDIDGAQGRGHLFVPVHYIVEMAVCLSDILHFVEQL